MRVRKKCTECNKLLLMSDFSDNSKEVDKKEKICISCLRDLEYNEFNKNINNNPLKLETMSLKEKRAAAAATAATPAATVKKAAPVAAAPKAAPVAAPKAAAPKAAAPKAAAPKAEAPVVKAKKAKLKISQFDLATGKLIQEFIDVDAAAASVGKHTKYIDICAKNGSKSAYGFDWLYEGYTKEAVVAPVKPAKVIEKPVPGDLDFDPEAEQEEEDEEEEFEPEFEDEEEGEEEIEDEEESEEESEEEEEEEKEEE